MLVVVVSVWFSDHHLEDLIVFVFVLLFHRHLCNTIILSLFSAGVLVSSCHISEMDLRGGHNFRHTCNLSIYIIVWARMLMKAHLVLVLLLVGFRVWGCVRNARRGLASVVNVYTIYYLNVTVVAVSHEYKITNGGHRTYGTHPAAARQTRLHLHTQYTH